MYVLKDASSLDESAVLERIPQNMPFAGIAQDFRIIDSGDCAVIVPHEQNRTLLDALREFGPSRSLLRRLGTDTVNLRRSEYQSLLDAGLLEEVGGNLAVLGRSDLYDSFTGLKTETELIF